MAAIYDFCKLKPIVLSKFANEFQVFVAAMVSSYGGINNA